MSALDSSLGALFIGLIIASVFHGGTLAQAWYFFSSQGNQFEDSAPLKLLVAVVVALDFIHQVCISHWMYTFCVARFGNLAGLALLPPSYLGMAYPTGFVTLLVQGFYVWRIWKLANKNWFVPAAIMVCSFVQEGVQLYSMTIIGKNPDATQFTAALTNIVIVVNGIGAGIDVLIALAMIFFLAQKRGKFARTNHILRSIAINSMTTGALTSICAILVLTTAIALPTTQWVLTFYLLLTRMYSNSLLATLNVRQAISRGASGQPATGSLSVSGHVQTNPGNMDSYRLEDLKRAAESGPHATHQSIAIKVDRRTDVAPF